MKTYFRILSFARPIGALAPQYVIYATLSIFFGLINLMLFIPLLEVLFDQISPEQLEFYMQKPQFEWTAEYFKNAFYHFFINFSNEYGKTGSLAIICVSAITGNFLANGFKYASLIIMAKLKAKIIYNLRMKFLDNITQMHIGFFTDQRKGDIMSRMSSDVSEIEFVIKNTLQVIFREPVTVIAYFIVLFSLSFKLTLFGIILLPVAGTIVSAIVKKLRRIAKDGQISLGKILSHVEELISGMRVIKAFNAEKAVVGNIEKEVHRYRRLTVGMARKNELAHPVSEFLGISMVAVTLMYGGSLVLSEQSGLSASAFIGYLVIFVQIMNPIRIISKAYSNLQRGIVAGDRVFEVIDSYNKIPESKGAAELKSFEDSIEFKDVSFYYEKKKKVLKNINIRVQKGQTVALVGPSGGGKSTIADLVPRFYDPTEGEVQIDGQSLKSYTMASIRDQMGIVTQESILFNDTIHNNIAFGIEASREDVIAAAKIANAHEFIDEMWENYDTMIGERGSKLSGGQRQRLSIARAILKNPDILILDEATSALDTESEKLVQEAITHLMQNRTSLVIAHRLSTIKHADRIIVLKEGKIEEEGTHEELVKNGGLYNKLIKLQNV